MVSINMAKCKKCQRQLSKFNKVGLCKACYQNRNNQNNNNSNGIVSSNVLSIPSVIDDQINDLQELPLNWFDVPIQDLNGGHLLKIILHANNSLIFRVSMLDERITVLEESLANNEELIASQETEVVQLKKGIVNQQSFLEQIQCNNLIKNVMITGIPNNNVIIGNAHYSDTKEKIDGILRRIDVVLDYDDYELRTFEISDERTTHAAKMIFKDIETKTRLMSQAKKLKDNEHFSNVYVRNDETKLARKENYRLWQKARELRSDEANVNAVIKIEKGKLIHNDIIVDQYNISNQIFC